jgi:hypothetical protein
MTGRGKEKDDLCDNTKEFKKAPPLVTCLCCIEIIHSEQPHGTTLMRLGV